MKAFTSYNSLEDFTSKIIDSVYSGASYDEFLLMKNLIAMYRESGKFYEVNVTAVTDEASAKAFAKKTRKYCNDLTFMSSKYNSAGVKCFTPLEDQVILIKSDYEASMSVDVLAYAFNMDKADFLAKRIIVDDFGGSVADNTVAMLIDKDWFMIYDTKFEMTEQYNAKHLYWNYFLHIWQILSVSEFSNAIIFTTDSVAEASIESVSILPATADVQVGSGIDFRCEVVALNGASREVTYSVTGANSDDTSINEDGHLVVGTDESADTLTITATSVADASKTDTASVDVLVPSVTSVDVTPATKTLAKGGTQQFTASVVAENGASEQVLWTVTGASALKTGTTIVNGLLTVASDETVTPLTVTATSVFNSSKSDTASVTVTQ